MTGPEHYREAERLIRVAKNTLDGTLLGGAGLTREEYVQLAQVHATLAQAAATIDAADLIDSGEQSS